MIARALRLVFKTILWFVLISILWVVAYRFVPPPITFTMIGDLLGGHSVTKDWTPLSRIDPDMPRAAIAGEDSRFCSHHGFDYKAIAGAAARNMKGGRIRGGSTISQQTAKNAFLFQRGGYIRKAFEAYFTVLIEAIWGKRRIMEVYLNIAETGIGTYGVEAGAIRYFNHSADRLSASEAGGSRRCCRSPRSARRSPPAASCGGMAIRWRGGCASSGTTGWTRVSADLTKPHVPTMVQSRR